MPEWMKNMYLLPSHQLENGDAMIYRVSPRQEIMNTQRTCDSCWDRAILTASASKETEINVYLMGPIYPLL